MRVERVDTQGYWVPMSMPWDAAGSDLCLIVTTLTTTTGATGTGFTWSPSVGALALQTLIVEDCHPLVEGSDVVHPEAAWDALWRALRESGSGGMTTLAMAAMDLARWDLHGKLAGKSLVDLIGRRRDRVPAYASGVNRHLTIDELVDQARRWVAAGQTRFKMKVGLPELAEDVDRVAAVRQVIGDDAVLMIDANQLWDVPKAIAAMKALASFNPFWVEEPLPADDFEAHVILRKQIDVPIAAGESLYNVYQFRHLLVAGGVDFAQPNCCRVGGVTPYLRISAVAHSVGVPVVPHLLPELSAQLAMCSADPGYVEAIDQAWFSDLGVLAAPSGVTLEADEVTVSSGPGLGLTFDTDGLAKLEPRGTS